jgi:hypothetical protein
LFAWLALFLLTPDKRQTLGRFRILWPVLALGAMPFAMYALVHAESRYLSPFFVLLWTALFSGVLEDRRISLAIAATAALLMLAETGVGAFTAPTDQPPAQTSYEIAHDLERLGLKPGDDVAIAERRRLPYYWARLAGARVTLEISFGDGYRQRQAEWTAARQILASRAATILVSPPLDGVTDQPGWRRLGTTHVFAYPIRPAGAY